MCLYQFCTSLILVYILAGQYKPDRIPFDYAQGDIKQQ